MIDSGVGKAESRLPYTSVNNDAEIDVIPFVAFVDGIYRFKF